MLRLLPGISFVLISTLPVHSPAFFPKPLPSVSCVGCGSHRSDYSKSVGGQFIRTRLKIAKKCGLYLDIFSCVKMNVFRSFFFRFQARDACQMRWPVQNWGRQGKYFGTDDAVWVHGYLRFEPGAWKWNEGLPCLCGDCKIPISPILFKFSHSLLDWTVLSWNFWGDFF